MSHTNLSVNTQTNPWNLTITFNETKIADIDISGISRNVFNSMQTLDMETISKEILKKTFELEEIVELEQKYKQINKILWTRLRDVFKLVIGSLKTLGDKSYEFLLVIFIMKYIKDANTNNKFLIETRDNHFINSLFMNIIPLIRILNSNNDRKNKFDIGFRFPILKEFLPESLRNNPTVPVFVYNSDVKDPIEQFYTPPLKPAFTESVFHTPDELPPAKMNTTI